MVTGRGRPGNVVPPLLPTPQTKGTCSVAVFLIPRFATQARNGPEGSELKPYFLGVILYVGKLNTNKNKFIKNIK